MQRALSVVVTATTMMAIACVWSFHEAGVGVGEEVAEVLELHGEGMAHPHAAPSTGSLSQVSE